MRLRGVSEIADAGEARAGRDLVAGLDRDATLLKVGEDDDDVIRTGQEDMVAGRILAVGFGHRKVLKAVYGVQDLNVTGGEHGLAEDMVGLGRARAAGGHRRGGPSGRA